VRFRGEGHGAARAAGRQSGTTGPRGTPGDRPRHLIRTATPRMKNYADSSASCRASRSSIRRDDLYVAVTTAMRRATATMALRHRPAGDRSASRRRSRGGGAARGGERARSRHLDRLIFARSRASSRCAAIFLFVRYARVWLPRACDSGRRGAIRRIAIFTGCAHGTTASSPPRAERVVRCHRGMCGFRDPDRERTTAQKRRSSAARRRWR